MINVREKNLINRPKLLSIVFSCLFVLFSMSYSSPSDYKNYYTVSPGPELDDYILKMSLRKKSYQIKDTIYFLSPHIDPFKEEEYSKGSDLRKLFARYSPHPIPLMKYQFDSVSVTFASDGFPLGDNKISFEFQGTYSGDEITGKLISLWYVGILNETFSDTDLVTFTLSRYKPLKQPTPVRYQAGVVREDSIPLEHGEMLRKGDTVQVVAEKCTEEGVYVRTKHDSDAVYYTHIATLCWLKKDSKGTDLKTGQVVQLLKNKSFIFEGLEDGYIIISEKERMFQVVDSLIVFDNKEFFEKITK